MRRAGIVPAPFTHPAAYVVDTRYILQRAALLLEPDGQPFYIQHLSYVFRAKYNGINKWINHFFKMKGDTEMA